MAVEVVHVVGVDVVVGLCGCCLAVVWRRQSAWFVEMWNEEDVTCSKFE